MDSILPVELLDSLEGVPGFNRASFKEVHDSGRQVVSVRFNPAKLKKDPHDIFPGCEKTGWSEFGYYLPERPSFTLDPLLHAGVYYVQEASSMFLEQCILQHADVNSQLRVLDLCGAPGGKSTHLQSLISSQSLLVSNEVIKSRVNVLSENVTKWGGANVIVTNNDPEDFSRLTGFFDVMVVDAPCSGSGLFRRDASAMEEWSMEAVQMCSSRQQRILAGAYGCLKKGGLLVYSTCSYSVEENEEICDWMMDRFGLESLPLVVKPEWGIIETQSERHHASGYRFFPDKVKGEGFFTACFRKKEEVLEYEAGGKLKKPGMISSSARSVVEPWVNDFQSYTYHEFEDMVFAFPQRLNDDLNAVYSSLYLRKAGVKLGKIIRGELVPDHELAVSIIVNKDLPYISLNKEDALQYLRKEEVKPGVERRGWSLVKYAGENLGWVKLLGNRINNYYPREWRILKSGKN